MTCIDERLLQKYIDGECNKDEVIVVKKHISDCSVCLQKLAEKEKVSAEIKRAINTLEIENIEIPVFNYTKSTSGRNNFKLIIYSLVAACILLFVLLFVDRKNDFHQKEIIIVQSIPREVDANRPAGEQELIIEVYDGKGHRSEYNIQ